MSNFTLNETNNYTAGKNKWQGPQWLFWTHIIGLSLLMIVIIFGNILEVYCLLRIKEMRTVTGMFILNLALTDLSVGFYSIPLSVVASIKHELLHTRWFCVLNGSALILFLVASILTLAAISIQKYMTVGYNMQTRFTRKRAWQTIAGIWAVSVTLAGAPILGWGKYTFTTGGNQCAPFSFNAVGHSYLAVLLLTVFFIPVCVMSYCYVKLYLFTRHHIRVLKSRTGTRGKQTISDMRMIQTLIIIMLFFILCWLPSALFYIVKIAGARVKRDYETIVLMLAYGNSALNPIIYALRHETFRKGCWSILRSICQRGEERSNRVGSDNKMAIIN